MSDNLQGMSVALDARLAQRLAAWVEAEGKAYGAETAAAVLLDEILAEYEGRSPRLSDGERLLLQMLSEVHTALDAAGGAERERMLTALEGGHLWAIADHKALAAPSRRLADVDEVRRTLTMFRAISNTLGGLSAAEAAALGELLHGPQTRFLGYGRDQEPDFVAIAQYIIHERQMFAEQAGVELGARTAMRGVYRPMLAAWDVIARDRAPGRLTLEQLADILRAGLGSL